jgi:hypothetical protein
MLAVQNICEGSCGFRPDVRDCHNLTLIAGIESLGISL